MSTSTDSRPVRRGAWVLALLVACTVPAGAEVATCDAGWRNVQPLILDPGDGGSEAVPIDCMRPIERRRLRIGFTMPAGPECRRLQAVEVSEAADAVSITIIVRLDDDPAAGACPDEPRRAVTEIDLAAPVANRALLDGSLDD